ncbi:putative lipoprotein [Segatella salivae F0493]|uniref:Putative lipoprotein n=1 Tax=Segatella salivae F0493 TaxID=1395125 RepID=U2L097_9BACT|nr:putative lipoprotein [Segatella salivae F0493]
MMLRSHNIRNGEYIHRNISVTPIALYGCNIPIDGYIY